MLLQSTHRNPSAPLCDPSSWPQLSPLLCAPFSVPHPLLNPVQSSLPQTHCDTLSCPHAPASKAAILPASPSVTFHVPFRLFHTLLTHPWGTLPDSPPSSLHHSTAAFRLLPQSHPSQLKPPSALSPGPAVRPPPPPLPPSQQSPLPRQSPALTSPTPLAFLSVWMSPLVLSAHVHPRPLPFSLHLHFWALYLKHPQLRDHQAGNSLLNHQQKFQHPPPHPPPHNSGALFATSTCSLSAWSWVLCLHV